MAFENLLLFSISYAQHALAHSSPHFFFASVVEQQSFEPFSLQQLLDVLEQLFLELLEQLFLELLEQLFLEPL